MTQDRNHGGRRPTLTWYVSARLGPDPRAQARNFLARPFGSGSFAGFWRYWNPVYGYVLLFFVYRPLRRFLPRPLATWLTFVLCGLLFHDAIVWIVFGGVRFPALTVLFAVFGAAVLVTDACRIDLSGSSFGPRVMANAAALAVCFLIWWGVLRVLGQP